MKKYDVSSLKEGVWKERRPCLEKEEEEEECLSGGRGLPRGTCGGEGGWGGGCRYHAASHPSDSWRGPAAASLEACNS